MQPGDILGHEPIRIIIEAGGVITNLKNGDRVAIPFTVACG